MTITDKIPNWHQKTVCLTTIGGLNNHNIYVTKTIYKYYTFQVNYTKKLSFDGSITNDIFTMYSTAPGYDWTSEVLEEVTYNRGISHKYTFGSKILM